MHKTRLILFQYLRLFYVEIITNSLLHKPLLLLGTLTLLITSCSVQKDPILQHNENSKKPTIYQYEYIGFEYPDSLADASDPMGELLNSLPKDPPVYYIIGDQNVALVRYHIDGTLSERKVYSIASDKVILFTYDDDGQYFRNLSDVKDNSIDRLEKGLPSEAKYYNGIKCEKYTLINEDGRAGNSVFINEAIPINYYRGLENVPKGIPFYSTNEFMMGIKINYGIIDTTLAIKKTNALLNLSTKDYIDIDAINNEIINSSNLQKSISDLKHRQTTYFSIRNDTIIATTPRCRPISKFQLNIEPEALRLEYIISSSNDTTITVSNGPIYDIEVTSDTLSTAKYSDEFSDVYSFYIESSTTKKSFAQIWKTRKKSAYLWESFSQSCLNEDQIIEILQDASSGVFGIDNPKVFLSSDTDFQNTPWMMEIAEFAFSRD